MIDGKPNRRGALHSLRRRERAAALEALTRATKQFETAETMRDKVALDIAKLRATVNRPIPEGMHRAAGLTAASVERNRLLSDLKATEKKAHALEVNVTEAKIALAAAKDNVARAQRALVALDDNFEPFDAP